MTSEKYLPLSAAMTEAAAILKKPAMYPSSCLLSGGWVKESHQRLLIRRHYLSCPTRMKKSIGDNAEWTLVRLHSPAEEEKGYSVCQLSRRSALTLRPSHKWSAYASLHVQAEAQQRTEAEDWDPPCLPRPAHMTRICSYRLRSSSIVVLRAIGIAIEEEVMSIAEASLFSVMHLVRLEEA